MGFSVTFLFGKSQLLVGFNQWPTVISTTVWKKLWHRHPCNTSKNGSRKSMQYLTRPSLRIVEPVQMNI